MLTGDQRRDEALALGLGSELLQDLGDHVVDGHGHRNGGVGPSDLRHGQAVGDDAGFLTAVLPGNVDAHQPPFGQRAQGVSRESTFVAIEVRGPGP